MNNKKVNELNIEMSSDDLAKERGHLKPTDTVKLVPKSNSSTNSSYSTMEENDETIEPTDKETIKYLSNVIDEGTNEVSQPFTIDGKKYQVVRGKSSKGGEVQGVYCFNDSDENGNPIIHSIEYFDKNIATPAKERIEREASETTYEGYKHYLVNKKTNEVRKFKNIKEMLSLGKLEEEDYMGVGEFKKHMNEKLFGKRKKLGEEEIGNQAMKPDVERAIEQMILKMKPFIDKLNEPMEKIQFIAKLTSMLNIDPSKISSLMITMKNILKNSFNTNAPTSASVQNVAESKVLTKQDLENTLNQKTVIKTIKIKNIK